MRPSSWTRFAGLAVSVLATALTMMSSGPVLAAAKWDGPNYQRATQVVSPSWWNQAWGQRKKVVITEQTGSSLTDFQVKVPVAFEPGMRSDFSDVRFVTDNGTELSYWRNNLKLVPSSFAEFWVKVPLIPASDNATIYMYYANSAAATTSSIYGTFMFADDFEQPYAPPSGNVTTSYNIDPYMYAHAVGGEPVQRIVTDGSNHVYEASGDNTGKTVNSENLDEPILLFGHNSDPEGDPDHPTLTALPDCYIAEVDVKPLIKDPGVADNGTRLGAVSAYITGRYNTVNDKYEQVLDFTNDQVLVNKVVWDDSIDDGHWYNLYPNAQKLPSGLQTQVGAWYTLTAGMVWTGSTNAMSVTVNGIYPALIPDTTCIDPPTNPATDYLGNKTTDTGIPLYGTQYGTQGPKTYMGLGLITYNNSGPYAAQYDNFRVRQYAWQEPTVTVGSPQTLVSVTTAAATGMTSSAATLHGQLSADFALNGSVSVAFEYGISGYTLSAAGTPATLSAPGSFSASLVNLQSGSTYHVRTKVSTSSWTLYGNDVTFQTQPPQPTVIFVGGGGGGGGAPATPGYTSLSPYINSEGMFNLDATIKSEDGKVWVAIKKGTVATTSIDAVLREIGISKTSNPPAPPQDWRVVVPAYDFLPEGAKFAPSISICFAYDPASLPAGLKDTGLVIMAWDPSAQKWSPLSGTVTDTTGRTVSGPLSHFSTYALMISSKPANISVSNLVISPVEVDAGGLVNISVTVANTGDLAGTYGVTLVVDDKKADARDVSVAGGASSSVSFSIAGSPGQHTVNVNGLSGTYTVKAPPAPAKLSVGGLTVSPKTVSTGENVTVRAYVSNSGDVEGSVQVRLTVDGSVVATRDVKVAGGATENVLFTLAAASAGEHTVNLNDLSETFAVAAKTPTASGFNWLWVVIPGGIILVGLVVVLAVRKRG